MTEVDRTTQKLADRQARIAGDLEALALRPTMRPVDVIAVDDRTRRVLVEHKGGAQDWLPVIDESYVPKVGHRAQVVMNGNEAVGAMPPKGPDDPAIINSSGEIPGVEQAVNGGAEDGVLPWIAGAGTTLVQSSTLKRSGAQAFRLNRTASTGDASMTLPDADARPCEAGKTYLVVHRIRPGATARTSRIDIVFLRADNSVALTVTSPNLSSVVGVWTELWMTGTCPEDAVKYRPIVHASVLGTAPAGEFHYVDDIEMHEAVPGMATSGAKAWLFDADVEGWTGGTWSADGALSGTGCILSNPGASQLYSQFGTSGQATAAGRKHTVFAYLRPLEGNGTQRNAHLQVDWYDAGGVFISGSVGPAKLIVNGEYTQLKHGEITAPANTAFVGVQVLITSPGGSQQWRLDTVAITMPPIVRIRRNTNPAYCLPGETTSIEVRALATGIATVQFPWGLNGDTESPIPVVAGDSWRLSVSYINDAANTVLRNVALVATWYDEAGQFIGIDLKQTPISTNPGSGFQTMTETFDVQDGAHFMRARIVYLPGAAGEALYLARVITQRVSLTDAKVQPRGPVYAQDADESYAWAYLGTTGAVWVSTPAFLVIENPGVPIAVEAKFSGYTQADAGISAHAIRVGITFDNFMSWTYGQDVWDESDSSYVPTHPQSAAHTRKDVPIGPVFCWLEIYEQNIAHANLYGQLSWRTIPI